MQSLHSFIITTAFILLSHSVYAQVNDQNIRLKVLQKSRTNHTFKFGRWTEDGGTETHLRYLGKVSTKSGQTFKIMTCIWFWGLSKRATNRILVFNERNQYVGNYGVTMIYDLPTMMKNGGLIFENSIEDSSCDIHTRTVINLKHDLPKSFFRRCKGNLGDLYAFEGN